MNSGRRFFCFCMLHYEYVFVCVVFLESTGQKKNSQQAPCREGYSVSVSGGDGQCSKLLLLWRSDLSVYLSPSIPTSLPPPSPEASKTQMFYTAYEMFEGHRKRKSAWFPLCWASWSDPPLPLSCMHSSYASWIHRWPVSAHVQSSQAGVSTYNSLELPFCFIHCF